MSRTAPTVLLIEDDDFYAALVIDMLEDRHWTVARARDGGMALDSACDSEPAAVILDLGMPGPSGLDILRRLRADPATRDVPVVVLTGHDLSTIRDEAYDAGATRFLAKPVDGPRLNAVLAEVVGGGA